MHRHPAHKDPSHIRCLRTLACVAQILSFNPVYRRDVLRGVKTTTVRWNEALHLGPAAVVFEDEPARQHAATILRLSRHLSDHLTAADVGSAQDTDMKAFVEQLRRNHYSTMPDVATLTVVTFTVLTSS